MLKSITLLFLLFTSVFLSEAHLAPTCRPGGSYGKATCCCAPPLTRTITTTLLTPLPTLKHKRNVPALDISGEHLCPRCTKGFNGYCCNARKTIFTTKTVRSRTTTVSHTTIPTPQPTIYNVGAVGAYRDELLDVYPVIWTGPNISTELEVLQDLYNSQAESIMIYQNSTYISGYAHVAPSKKRERGVPKPVYWIDGKVHQLPMPQGRWLSADASSIGVWKGKIIMTGTTGDWSDHYALLWQDYQVSLLPSQPWGAFAGGMFVDGNDFYLAGAKRAANQSTDYRAGYWKNLAWVSLESTRNSMASSIFVRNGHVYVSGERYENSVAVWGYWKDEVFHARASPDAGEIFVTPDNTLYQAGAGYIPGGVKGGYWKNDDFVELSPPTGYRVNGVGNIQVKNGIVYCSGSVVPLSGGDDRSVYWIGNQVYMLENRNGDWGTFNNGMLVV